MPIASESSAVLRRNLHEIAGRQKVSPRLEEHLERYFADADLAGVADASPEALHGAALQHFRLGETRAAGQVAIALYAPDFDRHGWHSPQTAIDIVTDDMPFLVDSVTMVLHRRGLAIHRLLHPLLCAVRDAAGRLERCLPRGAANARDESWMHLEIERIGDPAEVDALRGEILEVLADCRATVEDLAAMRERMSGALAAAGEETAEYLRWAAAGNFVFLGYADYRAPAGSGDLARVEGSGLGILRHAGHARFGRCLAGIPGALAELAKDPSPLTLVKADARSTIHRDAHLDFIGVKQYDAQGRIVGEHAFVGLYAAHVYHGAASGIPVLRRKIAAVRAACAFAPDSHRDKTLLNVLETFPRDELFEIAHDDLLRIARDIVTLQERQRVRVFLRHDSWGRYVSALIYLPRDRFDTGIRKRVSALLRDSFHAESVDFFIMLTESRLARIHFIARTPVGSHYRYDAEAIEAEVARIVRGWDDELKQNLVAHCGEERGNRLWRRYAADLPAAYREQVSPASAVSDLERLAAAEASGRIEVKLCAAQDGDGAQPHLKLFHAGQPRALSAILPLLENTGLTVLAEQPFSLPGSGLQIADFALQLPQRGALDDENTRRAFVGLLEQLLGERAENDGFNRLVLLAGLDERRIAILRAYSHYLRQAGLPFSQPYIERCLAAHPEIARLLAGLFEARFAPQGDAGRAAGLGEALAVALSQVANLDDDRILSGFRTAIEATLRTNAYQTGRDGLAKEYLSFKFSSAAIPFLPKPAPLYEIFVCSPRMEGIHLRGARVARGGLRWSDRMEDFRTEVLGLVKAQMVKNAVIVPLGSKGGFVCKRLPPAGEREAFQAEGIACYSTFIRGLLDLTDNLVDGRVVAPPEVRRHDGDDPYLVVAADKGTATFSDIANGIAIEYGFWLGDAFASGGSAGYDHKKMGITARGAWEAVKRHFREMGRDTQSEEFTVLGIGDLSGDVFGNGMLLSPKIRLLAAFDHRHIFIDPDPDCATSFAERQRLFDLPRSSWDDYERSRISAGGGVWPRHAKSIPLAPKVRDWLGVAAEQLSPAELINALLRAPVDLLYNGGIGTWVKAGQQSHQEANDRANDGLRIDASQLKARVVSEGGNLGFTQKGRIEFALNGGRMFTDAIDNSAGVDCSDHEVNIKILLAGRLASGDMTGKQRDALLAEMTDDVARLVLADNYQQTQAISLEAAAGASLLDAHARLIRHLEAQGTLNRSIESLPDDKALAERGQQQRGLSAPEIAVLLAYAKIALKEAVLASGLPDRDALRELLADYFPPALGERFGEQLPTHPLRREIVATQLVNRLVNRMGTSFVLRLCEACGAAPDEVAAAWYAASRLLGAETLWQALEALDLVVPAGQQMAHMNALREMVADATRLLLTQHAGRIEIGELLGEYGAAVAARLEETRHGREGAEAALAIVGQRAAIVDVFRRVHLARSSGCPLAQVDDALDRLDAELDLAWLALAIDRLPGDNRWQARARARLATDLDSLLRHLIRQLQAGALNAGHEARALLDELKRNAPQDLAMLSAGLTEIGQLMEHNA